MSKLVIINGASGAGKTYLLEQISQMDHDLVAIKKYTTRCPRGNENPKTACDLHFYSDESKIKSMEFSYEFKNEWYGIDKAEIENALRKGKYPSVIIRDYPTLIKLRETYGTRSLAFYIQGAFSGRDLNSLLRKQGRSRKEAKEAVKRNKLNFDMYYHYMTQDLFDDMNLFDAFIVNYYDEKFLGQFEYHLKSDRKRQAIGA